MKATGALFGVRNVLILKKRLEVRLTIILSAQDALWIILQSDIQR